MKTIKTLIAVATIAMISSGAAFAGDVHFRGLLQETGFREIAARVGLLDL